jgi:hypothetical protein
MNILLDALAGRMLDNGDSEVWHMWSRHMWAQIRLAVEAPRGPHFE